MSTDIPKGVEVASDKLLSSEQASNVIDKSGFNIYKNQEDFLKTTLPYLQA